MSKPIGSGLPSWLDTDLYLNADEVRALGTIRFGGVGRCGGCGQPPGPPVYRLEGAHIWRGGMSGRKDGGPTVELCYDCHQGPNGIDRVRDKALAIRRRDLAPVLLTFDGEIHEQPMKW